MKPEFTRIALLLTTSFFLSLINVQAQKGVDYNLLPGAELTLPIGESSRFIIYRSNGIDVPQFGTATQFSNVVPPTWTLNGQPSDAPANAEGRLIRDLTFTKATYYAPDKVPKINPVTIAVKFKANDNTKEEVTLLCSVKIVDPGKNWVFTYTCSKFSLESWKSPHNVHTKSVKACGSGYLVIDAPKEEEGSVIINTEQGDKVINSSANGSYNYRESNVTTGLNNKIEEKRIINYSGKPEQAQGLLFEYNSRDKGDQGGIQGAGLSFDVKGTDEMWNRDANGNLRKFSDTVNEKNQEGILLGSKDDKVTKIKNGFVIDYIQSKDTTYSKPNDREQHSLKLIEKYHAVLTSVNKK